MNQGKLEVVKQEMARMNIDILGISKLRWTGMGKFNSDDHYIYYCGQFSSVQFSRSVMSDSLQAHELQHVRPPYPSPSPEFTQTHVHQVDDAIQPSHSLSSTFPPALNPSHIRVFPMSQLFA